VTQLCLTTYNFPSFTQTTGTTHFLDVNYAYQVPKIGCDSFFKYKEVYVPTYSIQRTGKQKGGIKELENNCRRKDEIILN